MSFKDTRTDDDYETGTIAAACGGITSLIDFTMQQKGETLRDCIERKKEQATGKAAIDYSLHPGLTDPRDDIIDEIKNAILDYGTPSIKAYMVYSFRVDDDILIRLLEATGKHGGLLQVHAENPAVIGYLNGKFAGAGQLAPYYHALSRPPLAEEEAVAQVCKLTQLTGSRVYVVHLSSAAGLRQIRAARDNGIDVIAETCPQYLLLSEERYQEPDWGGAKYVMSPPLRTADNNDALWQGINSGDVHVIGTDHCPFSFKGQKDRYGKDDYKKIPNGAPGIETTLMMLHTEGVVKGRISLPKMVDILAARTARIFGLSQKGEVAVGKDADIVVFDPTQKFTVTNERLHMNVDYTPFEGWEVTGMPHLVFSRGKQVARWKNDHVEFIGEKGRGRFVKRVPFRRGL
jgi:dihydropyrimidinase